MRLLAATAITLSLLASASAQTNQAGGPPRFRRLRARDQSESYAAGARKLPLVFWHGHGQSAKTWETTPDGREGFQNIFLRRRFSVYLIDQPLHPISLCVVNLNAQ